jgi:dolichol-phosphate mannosyltransferase
MDKNELQQDNKMLSVVIPAYNEEGMVLKTAETLKALMDDAGIIYELIFVNDGSSDLTQERIEEASEKDPSVRYVCFSRNFGKEAAIFAGLGAAKGGCAAVMDCDLQHPPEVLIEMYRLWEEGYEIVEGVKKSRGRESIFHKLSAGMFYGIMSKATKIDMYRASDFKLLDRRAVEALLMFPEYHVFFRALSSWIGYKKTSVEFDVRDREVGSSKWSTSALFKYAVNNIVEYSAVPLHLITGIGVVSLIFAFALGIQTLVRYFCGTAAEGFTTVILLQLFSASVIMIGIGIVGLYLAKIYDEVKRRPRYIIAKMK